MRWILAVAALAASFGVAHSQPTIERVRQGLAIHKGPKTETYPGYIVVKYRPSRAATIEAQASSARLPQRMNDAIFKQRMYDTGWTLWTYPSLLNFDTVRARFLSDPDVLHVQPLNRIYPMITEPNDPDWNAIERDETYILNFGEEDLSFRRLWHLDDISAQAAFSVFPNKWYTASDKIFGQAPTIAVIDTGCDVTHPDFANAGWPGTGAKQGGQIWHQKSKYFSFGSVLNGDVNDRHGHGTHVAGIALASGNNGGFEGRGTVGTGYACKGMILRVFDNSGNGSDWDAASAMYFAADQKAHVINLSLGTENYSQLFQDASTYAWQMGSLIVAAGNEDGSGGGDLGPIYPAACSGVLGVSANGPGQVPAASTYSGSGMYVDIAAPGGDAIMGTDHIIIQFVYSTAMRTRGSLEELSDAGVLYPPYTRNYSYLVGTSMASPAVAGAAGTYYAMKGMKHGFWNNATVYKELQKSADGVMGANHGGWEPYQGYGSLNMYSLLTNTSTRGATAGGFEGLVYANGTPMANVSVRARRLTNGVPGGFNFTTTTNQHGFYRYDVLPPGEYEVTAAPSGLVKSKRLEVEAGCDTTGFDFWCGTYTGDETKPLIGLLAVQNNRADRLRFNHWVRDPETGIDKITYRIGTTSGGQQVMPEREFNNRSAGMVITGITLVPGTTYYLRGQYTNGAGMINTRVVSFVAQ